MSGKVNKKFGSRAKKYRSLGIQPFGSQKQVKRNYAPGQHGKTSGSSFKTTAYAVQLKEKQTIKLLYGMKEKQFATLCKKALSMKGNALDNIVLSCEKRLLSVIQHIVGFTSIRFARQIVSHKHILINGKTVNCKGYQLQPGDVVEFREKSRNIVSIQGAIEKLTTRNSPHITADLKNMKFTYTRNPDRTELPYLANINLQKVKEYYS